MTPLPFFEEFAGLLANFKQLSYRYPRNSDSKKEPTISKLKQLVKAKQVDSTDEDLEEDTEVDRRDSILDDQDWEDFRLEISSGYYTLIEYLLGLWHELPEPPTEEQAAAKLEAFLEFSEKGFIWLEKRNTCKRLYIPTSHGILSFGGRPLLAHIELENQRPPFSSDTSSRRIFLVTEHHIDYRQEILDTGDKSYSKQENEVILLDFILYKLWANKSIHIGLAALSGEAKTIFEPIDSLGKGTGGLPRFTYRSSKISNAGQFDDSAYKEELTQCLNWAVQEQITILCLPEMSVSQEGLSHMKVVLQELGSQGNLSSLAIIIAGSFHVDIHNQAPVWFINDDGTVIERFYNKFDVFETTVNPAKLPNNNPLTGLKDVYEFVVQQIGPSSSYSILEHMVPDPNILLINLPIGSAGILICKDFLGVSDSCYQKYRALQPDYLFIVSMNPHSSLEKEFSNVWRRNYKRSFSPAGYYINAQQVLTEDDNKTEVAFIGLPFEPETLYFRAYTGEKGTIVAPTDGLIKHEMSLPQPLVALNANRFWF